MWMNCETLLHFYVDVRAAAHQDSSRGPHTRSSGQAEWPCNWWRAVVEYAAGDGHSGKQDANDVRVSPARQEVKESGRHCNAEPSV